MGAAGQQDRFVAGDSERRKNRLQIAGRFSPDSRIIFYAAGDVQSFRGNAEMFPQVGMFFFLEADRAEATRDGTQKRREPAVAPGRARRDPRIDQHHRNFPVGGGPDEVRPHFALRQDDGAWPDTSEGSTHHRTEIDGRVDGYPPVFLLRQGKCVGRGGCA